MKRKRHIDKSESTAVNKYRYKMNCDGEMKKIANTNH
jgi:hypothetical protein